MRANSRSSIRWRVATAVVALALCALPKAALADGGGNGRLVAVRLAEPTADGTMADQGKGQPISEMDDDAGANSKITIDLRSSGDFDSIGDDSDIASVEGSANDTVDPGGELLGGSF